MCVERQLCVPRAMWGRVLTLLACLCYTSRAGEGIPTLSQPPPPDSTLWFRPWKISISHWPAVGKWTPEYLRKTFNTSQNPVRVGHTHARSASSSTVPYELPFSESVEELNFPEAARLVEEHQKQPEGASIPYMWQYPAAVLLDEPRWNAGVLRRDVDFGSLRPLDRHGHPIATQRCIPWRWDADAEAENLRFWETRIWFGGNGTRSGLHFDVMDNLHAVVFGEKTFVLFPPEDAQHLYPYPDVPLQSQVDPLDPDPQFSAFVHTHPRVVHLHAGEAIFLPALYWHWVESRATTVSVNWWHRRPAWRYYIHLLRSGGQEHRDELSAGLAVFGEISTQPLKLQRFYRAGGPSVLCRSWFALTQGFVERALKSLDSTRWRRQNTPHTLVMQGAALAKKLQHRINFLNLPPREQPPGADIASGPLKYTQKFRLELRDGIIRRIIARLDGPVNTSLSEAELQQYLLDAVTLLRDLAVEADSPLPWKDPHFDALFGGLGAGASFELCEALVTHISASASERMSTDL